MSWDGFPADDGDESVEIAAAFRAAPGGAAAYFEEGQAGVIRSLVSQIAELVSADAESSGETPAAGDLEAQLGLSSHAEAPDDPVLARLLPDGYAEDPEAASEFRKYTEQGLRDGKIAAARTVLDTLPAGGGRIRLSAPEAQAWLRALNDVRLALGVRLGVTDDFDERSPAIDRADPRSAYVWVYHWLAFLQESLVHALS